MIRHFQGEIQKQNLFGNVLGPQVPYHLFGFGKGRCLKLGGATMEDRVEQQL